MNEQIKLETVENNNGKLFSMMWKNWPIIFSAQRFGNGSGNAGLTDTRRSPKAQNFALCRLFQLTDRDELQYSRLDIFHPVMIFIQDRSTKNHQLYHKRYFFLSNKIKSRSNKKSKESQSNRWWEYKTRYSYLALWRSSVSWLDLPQGILVSQSK